MMTLTHTMTKGRSSSSAPLAMMKKWWPDAATVAEDQPRKVGAVVALQGQTTFSLIISENWIYDTPINGNETSNDV